MFKQNDSDTARFEDQDISANKLSSNDESNKSMPFYRDERVFSASGYRWDDQYIEQPKFTSDEK